MEGPPSRSGSYPRNAQKHVVRHVDLSCSKADTLSLLRHTWEREQQLLKVENEVATETEGNCSPYAPEKRQLQRKKWFFTLTSFLSQVFLSFTNCLIHLIKVLAV